MSAEVITEIGLRGKGDVVVGTPQEYADARFVAGSDQEVWVDALSIGKKTTHLRVGSVDSGQPGDVIVRHFPDRSLVTMGQGTANTESSAGAVTHIVNLSKARIVDDGGVVDIRVGEMTVSVKRSHPRA